MCEAMCSFDLLVTWMIQKQDEKPFAQEDSFFLNYRKEDVLEWIYQSRKLKTNQDCATYQQEITRQLNDYLNKDMEKLSSCQKEIDTLVTGTNFTQFFSENILSTPIILSRKITLFYEPNKEGKNKGLFYWYEVGSAYRVAMDESLPLDQLTDIYIGKQHEFFKSESTVRSDCAFSLVSTTNMTSLHLVADDVQIMQKWLKSFR